MNKQVINATLGALASVFLLASPGYSSTFLAFSDSAGAAGGTAVVHGNTSSETLTSVTGIDYNTLKIGSETWTLTSTNGSGEATLALSSGNTFTLTGEIGACTASCTGAPNLTGVSGALETFTVSSIAYNTNASSAGNVAGFYTTTPATQGAFTLAFGTPTSMTTLVALSNALGFSALTSTISSGGISSNSPATGPVSGNYTFTATSETLNATLTATPEPVTFFLVGGGLIGLACLRRRQPTRI